MIAEPINDRECLLSASQYVVGQLARADLRSLAARFGSTRELAAWIRSLPQLDDTGAPTDAPTIACDVPQRARVPSNAPNCFERALLYIVVGELIDTRPVRQLATLNTSAGRHTVAVEDGEVIILDPHQGRIQTELSGALGVEQRNASLTALDEQRKEARRRAETAEKPAAGSDGHLSGRLNVHSDAPERGSRRRRRRRRHRGERPEWVRMLVWFLRIAECHADVFDQAEGPRRVERVRAFFARRRLVPPPRSGDPGPAERADFAFAVLAALLGAEHYGARGIYGVAVVATALDKMDLLPTESRGFVRQMEQQQRNAGEDPIPSLDDLRNVDSWEPYRNAVELSHLVEPDFRNCACGGGMPRNAVEVDELRNAYAAHDDDDDEPPSRFFVDVARAGGLRALVYRNRTNWRRVGQQTLQVTHGIGRAILGVFGAGELGDQLGKFYEKQGWLPPKRTSGGPPPRPPEQPPPRPAPPDRPPPPTRRPTRAELHAEHFRRPVPPTPPPAPPAPPTPPEPRAPEPERESEQHDDDEA